MYLHYCIECVFFLIEVFTLLLYNFIKYVLFIVVFRTKDTFVKEFKLRYEMGDIFAYKGLDANMWSYLGARDIVKEN